MVKDWAYRVAFDRKDLPSLQEMVKHIRETHDTDMIENFNARCERHIKGEKDPQFQDVAKTEDLVVNGGLQQCINIILGTSSVRWSHLAGASPASATTPAVSDTALSPTGLSFIPMATLGWMEPRGMKLFFGAIAPTDTNGIFGNDRANEIGVFNGTAGSTMLNHEAFFNNRPLRTTVPDLSNYSSVFIFSSVIEFCPVA